MNKKGQALVEFVIILPIFLLLLFSIIDFGKILYARISLENLSNDTVKMYEKNKSFKDIQKFLQKTDKYASVKIENEDNKYINFYLNTKVNISTPGLNVILKSPYKVEVKRTVYYDK